VTKAIIKFGFTGRKSPQIGFLSQGAIQQLPPVKKVLMAKLKTLLRQNPRPSNHQL